MAPCLECRQLVPMNTPTCIVCESPIAPQLQPQNSIYIKGKVICQACGTGNPFHHKHCVTCESKLPEVQMPGPPPCYFTCSNCGTSNQPYARFCVSCGVYIEPPSRQSSPAQVAWQPHPVSLPKSRAELTEKEDKGTQTIGLFYPSSKLLEKKELELISLKEKMEKMSDHKPLLTAISPGKGYWRKQLDHVCAHLRSYAQNNIEFRTLIGEPQMGKVGRSLVWPTYSHFPCLKRDWLLSVSPQPESRQLLDELGQTGKGRIPFIEQLLSEGADPNALSEEERPALTVAVLNGHTGAISPLVHRGAHIDQQSGPHSTKCSHFCNASVQKKNAAGQSALDLAVAGGDNKVLSLFQEKMTYAMHQTPGTSQTDSEE
uniref:Double zinc ribbon and ankyrin repeat domains 1 n=1 Tax=Malurus cyaneus samueli TaxID=2593467 RepID=A0A8C5X3R4_9PASS